MSFPISSRRCHQRILWMDICKNAKNEVRLAEKENNNAQPPPKHSEELILAAKGS